MKLMKLILQEKVANLGNIGDQVVVKSGYARNFLLPSGKAVLVTPECIAEFEKRRAKLEKVAAELSIKARVRAEQLKNKSFRIIVNASADGHLFGSVGSREIAQTIKESGMQVEKREIDLSQGPIRQIGKYDVLLRLHTNVFVNITVEVVAEINSEHLKSVRNESIEGFTHPLKVE